MLILPFNNHVDEIRGSSSLEFIHSETVQEEMHDDIILIAKWNVWILHFFQISEEFIWVFGVHFENISINHLMKDHTQ